MKQYGAILLVLIVVIVSLVLFNAFANEPTTIVYVSEISRHGARTPGTLFDFAKDPNDEFTHRMQLTPVGRRQHFLIGHEIKNRYIHSQQVIDRRYDAGQVEFFATDTDRAIDSAISQLGGVFPPSEPMNFLNEHQRKNAVPPINVVNARRIDQQLQTVAIPFNVLPIFSERDDVNFALHFEKADCPAYQQKRTELQQSQEYAEMNAPHLEHLKPRLEELTGITEGMDQDKINSICSYLLIADFHKIELKFDVTEQDYEHCYELNRLKLFHVSWGHDLLWQLGSKVFYENLIEAMDNIRDGNTQAKMQLNFGHDYGISLMLNGLGVQHPDKIPFASTIFYELHKRGGDYYVRTQYNDRSLTFGEWEEVLCPLGTFKRHIRSIHPEGNIQDLCALDESEISERTVKPQARLLTEVVDTTSYSTLDMISFLISLFALVVLVFVAKKYLVNKLIKIREFKQMQESGAGHNWEEFRDQQIIGS